MRTAVSKKVGLVYFCIKKILFDVKKSSQKNENTACILRKKNWATILHQIAPQTMFSGLSILFDKIELRDTAVEC